MRRLRDAVGGRYDRLVESGRRSSARFDEAALAAAGAMHRRADSLVGRTFRHEQCSPPRPILVGSRSIDVLEDLAAYTRLPQATVDRLVVRRDPLSFRSEWHATAKPLRADHWFYLSSKSYLFGNASHFAASREIDLVDAVVTPGSRILDFGGGVGGLAIALAARGHHTCVDELNALQRDFLRFRVHRHDLQEHVTVLDPWSEVPRGAFDAVTAFDVFEHLPDGTSTLDERLLPALRRDGVLIEDSPFVRNVSNPMHHADWGLAVLLRERGFEIRSEDAHTRAWRPIASA